jgi:threonine synthase
MRYISTRGRIDPIAFQDAVMMGLADDGGLLIPESIPDVADRLDDWRRLGYDQLAFEVISLFVDDIPADDLRSLIRKTYATGAFAPEVAPTMAVGPLWVLELWHGPTLAFKDVALQLLGNLFEYILAIRGGRLNILGATSGDTGSAAIYGVRGRRGIDIFVMHPHDRVSPIQRRQMTTVTDANVHNIAIEGSFDDCQNIMKRLAGDLEFKRAYSIGAVNSVNWARVMAQIVYYFKTVFDIQAATGSKTVQVVVPTGNFGDILAGWYAMKMGLPIERLILATNENDILTRFFDAGEYRASEVHRTLSPSMDIQVASNFERYLYYKLGCDGDRLRGMMDDFARTNALKVAAETPDAVDPDIVAGSAGSEEVLATIARYQQDLDYLLDPHTAVGVAVAQRLADANVPTVCLATAHPAKFPAAIKQATGSDIAHHPAIDKLMELPERLTVLDGRAAAVREFIEKTLG